MVKKLYKNMVGMVEIYERIHEGIESHVDGHAIPTGTKNKKHKNICMLLRYH